LLDMMLAGIMSAATGSTGAACPEDAPVSEYHLWDVCDELLEGAPAYSVTYRESLSPGPASQQVMLYRLDSVWFIRVAGYRGEWGGPVETRRHEMIVSDADAEAVVGRLTRDSLEQLDALPYYGSKHAICMDGASLELAMASRGRRFAAAQHSCAGKTAMNDIAAIFRALALKYDSGFEGLLSGFKN